MATIIGQNVIYYQTIMNELILENIYEEVMDELTDTETLAMYSESDIKQEVMNRFWGRQ